jgi:hypothetical protein
MAGADATHPFEETPDGAQWIIGDRKKSEIRPPR